MFKYVHDEVWAFDAEWVPDPVTGRKVLGLDDSIPDDEVLARMWEYGGADEKNPRPYLKTILCRVVSVSALIRSRSKSGAITHKLFSLPDGANKDESEILRRFLQGIGKKKPQLVGFNSREADLRILIQRAMVHGLSLPEFCMRPAKPWDGIDYFTKDHDFNVDLRDVFSGWGKLSLTLHELATSSGIPGKIGTDGQDVVNLWHAGNHRRIVQYNECDALTTFLVWLRAAHLSGHVKTNDYEAEQEQLEKTLVALGKAEENGHIREYLDAWRKLRR